MGLGGSSRHPGTSPSLIEMHVISSRYAENLIVNPSERISVKSPPPSFPVKCKSPYLIYHRNVCTPQRMSREEELSPARPRTPNARFFVIYVSREQDIQFVFEPLSQQGHARQAALIRICAATRTQMICIIPETKGFSAARAAWRRDLKRKTHHLLPSYILVCKVPNIFASAHVLPVNIPKKQTTGISINLAKNGETASSNYVVLFI